MDLTGKRYGRLKVLRLSRQRLKGSKAWECLCDCGQEKVVAEHHLRQGNVKSCGCLKRDVLIKNNKARDYRGSKHPQWKGGYAILGNGYIGVYMPDHPGIGKKNYVHQHRLRMEEKLGRYLRPEEVVHHIDGDCKNNKIENLHLFTNQAAHAHWHNRLEEMALYD